MSKPMLSFLIGTVLMLFSPSGQQNQNSEFEMFMGKWKGKGTLFGTEANFSMSWKNTVNDKFIELNFENQFTTTNGEQKLTAKAIYWFIDEEHLKGNWYDSRGVVFPLKATFQNNVLTSLWGDSDSVERGKTVYQLTGNKGISVTDFVWRGEKMTQFGEAVYEKTN